MNKKSKLLSLLGILVVLAMLLSACGGGAEPTEQSQEPEASGETAAEEPVEEPAEEVVEEPMAEPVTLLWYLDGTPPLDEALVEEALAQLPQLKDLNVKVDLIFFDWGEFDQKMQLMFAGGEPCDLVFTASWANNYVNNAINGNLVALDDLLPTVTPKLWEMVPETAWNMSRVNGKIFAIPNQQLWYEAWGIILDKEIADKYSIDLTTINKYADFDPYLQKVLEGEPQLAKKVIGEMNGGNFHPLTWGYESVISAGVIKLGDMSRQIVDWYETPEFRQAVDQAWNWHEAGYSPDEILAHDTMNQGRLVGEYPFKFHVAKPGVDAEEKVMTNREQVYKNFQPPVLSYVIPTMTGVCTTSENPELALKFFELMFTDEEVYNMVAKGLEGKHWAWVEKDKKVIGFPEGVDASNSGWNINRDWMIGNQFIAYYVNADQVGAWEETAKVNSEASLPMDGPFVFDPTPVSAEVAAVDAVTQQFLGPLQWGLIDPNDPTQGMDAFLQALKDAGVEKVLAEMQTQLDAFVAANPNIFK